MQSVEFPQQPCSGSEIQNCRLLKGHEDHLLFPPLLNNGGTTAGGFTPPKRSHCVNCCLAEVEQE